MIASATFTERAIIAATQAGLPLVERPFEAVAAQAGATAAEVKSAFNAMQADGRLRRIAAVPNHYALGVTANGMSVWDVEDAMIGELGPRVGALDFVTHCYRRPRIDGAWSYNLFAMVHGRDRAEVEDKASTIACLLGEHCRGHDIIYSTRILKKTGFRYSS